MKKKFGKKTPRKNTKQKQTEADHFRPKSC